MGRKQELNLDFHTIIAGNEMRGTFGILTQDSLEESRSQTLAMKFKNGQEKVEKVAQILD